LANNGQQQWPSLCSHRLLRIPWIWLKDLASPEPQPADLDLSAARPQRGGVRPSIRRGSWVRSSVSPGDWRLGPRPSAARSGATGYCQTKKRPTLQIFEQIFAGLIIHIVQENAVGIFGM